jgi:hypothetical protein
MGLLLLIILILFLIGGLPRWGYHSYGYGPSGVVAVLVIVFAVLLLTGRLWRVPTGLGRQGQPRWASGVGGVPSGIPTGAQRLEAAVVAGSIQGVRAVKDDLRLATAKL